MFFRKKRAPDPTPPWIKWLVLGFLAVAILGNLYKNPTQGSLPHLFEKAENDIGKSFEWSDYKSKILPETGASLHARDTSPGTGAPVVCGQDVEIAYSAYGKDHALIESVTKEKPLTFRMGSGSVMPALEQGITGMRIGGRRIVSAPGEMSYSGSFARDGVSAMAPVQFDIELLSAKPALEALADTPYRIAYIAQGSGIGLLCGQTIQVHLTLWDVAGKKRYSTHDEGQSPIAVTPGKSEWFLGLEQGVIGMSRGSKRTLIVPPALQKTLQGTKPAMELPFPDSQTVLVDIEAVQ